MVCALLAHWSVCSQGFSLQPAPLFRKLPTCRPCRPVLSAGKRFLHALLVRRHFSHWHITCPRRGLQWSPWLLGHIASGGEEAELRLVTPPSCLANLSGHFSGAGE